MEIKFLKHREIIDFEKEEGLNLVIHEIPLHINARMRFKAEFYYNNLPLGYAKSNQSNMFTMQSDFGVTIEDAIIAFCNRLNKSTERFYGIPKTDGEETVIELKMLPLLWFRCDQKELIEGWTEDWENG